MSSSRSDKALKIAKEVQDEFFKGEKSLNDLLLRCKTICRYLGVSEENKWIDDELEGYAGKWKTHGEELKNFPSYRQGKLIFYTGTNTISTLSYKETKNFAEHPIAYSISEVEEFKEHYIVTGSATIDLLNEYIFKYVVNENPIAFEQFRIKKAELPSAAIRRIIGTVKKMIGQFVDETILELEYGKIPESIFEEIRQEVDHKFTLTCPNAIEKLTVAYSQLTESNPVVASQIASTCRRIILDVADAIYPPSEPIQKDGREFILDKSHYKNRILQSISENLTGDSQKKVFESMFDYIDNFLKAINDYASKGDHSDFKQTDAKRCVVYTYLLLGDILHYYSKE